MHLVDVLDSEDDETNGEVSVWKWCVWMTLGGCGGH
jgi:hypothetical protein